MKAVERTTHSADETFELARSIGEGLTGGEVFLLVGELGAGKTVFAKGIGAGLEIDPADVSSPTFTIINQLEGRLRLTHLDLYRLSGSYDEFVELGISEILEDEEGVVVVEWPERLGDLAPADAVRITIQYPAQVSSAGISDEDRVIHFLNFSA